DPRDEEKVAFKDLPDRFPSVLSRDFRREQYKDIDNLFAMHLLYNIGKYSVVVNDQTRLLQIGTRKNPMIYSEAAELATRSAKSDSENFRLRAALQPKGAAIGNSNDDTPLDQFRDDGNRKTAP